MMGRARSRFLAHLPHPQNITPKSLARKNLPVSLTGRVICAQILSIFKQNKEFWGRERVSEALCGRETGVHGRRSKRKSAPNAGTL